MKGRFNDTVDHPTMEAYIAQLDGQHNDGEMRFNPNELEAVSTFFKAT